MTKEQLYKIIVYSARVLPPHFNNFPGSIGCDTAVTLLRLAAGETLSEEEQQLVESSTILE